MEGPLIPDDDTAATPPPAAATPAAATAAVTAASPWRRRLLLWIVPLVVAAGAIALYGSTGRYVDTDNAYVHQDLIDVAPQVSGDVIAVEAVENEQVAAGQVILRLDDTTAKIAVAAAEARLGTARADIEALKASWREKVGQAAVAARAAELSSRELQRQQQLAAARLIPASQLDAVQRSTDIALGSATVMRLQAEQTIAKLGGNAGLPTDEYPAVQAAAAELARARIDLARSVVHAPQAGVVSQLPKVGSRAEMGRPAFAIVTHRAAWVEANLKETDLEWVRAGQQVEIEVDTYRQHRWHGTVESISQATGAAFSVLPPQNASGNWVKVVQRIPVRIALQPGSDDPPLRDGMSAEVRIDTGPHRRFDRWFAALRR
ncbi:MAG: HlyD family secretion protein [Sinobacteraceae bacterium]|nr:HlyD family secretion protein [Nevskiaceae bacterium]